MTETIIAAVLAAIAAVISFFLYGRRVQSQVDAGKYVKAAMKAIEDALNDSEERAKHDAAIIPNLPESYPDDTNDLRIVVPGVKANSDHS